jgi:hypothetical protein
MLKDIFKFYFWWFVISIIVIKFADIKLGVIVLLKVGIIAAPFLFFAFFWVIYMIVLGGQLADYMFRRLNHLTHYHDGRK